jgi:hypothetical protein
MSVNLVYNWSASINEDGAAPLNGAWSDVGSFGAPLSIAVAAGQTDFDVPISFNGANLQAMFLVSNQPVSIKVNSTGSPFSTIALKANVPFTWSKTASYYSNPLNVAVTHFYVTTTAAAIIKAKFLTT